MLTQLSIKNLAIVQHLELNLQQGMHVITGETGAGKSIIIDALSIALGERTSPEQIRANETQADVTVSFDITNLPRVQEILREQDLPCDECVIRRVISVDGRSRAYINGHSVAAQQIKSIAPYLVQIHSQHQHHALLESFHQRQLLDAYAKHDDLVKTVADIYSQWLETNRKIQELADVHKNADKLTLLNYQLQELEALNIQPDELNQLDQKHMQLAKGEELVNICQDVCNQLIENDNGDTNILAQLHHIQTQLTSVLKLAPNLNTSVDLINQAIIVITEAQDSIQNFANQIDLDPSQLQVIEARLSAIHALARKLKVAPNMLSHHYAELSITRNTLAGATEHLSILQQQLNDLNIKYQAAAQKLTLSRNTAAKRLTTNVMQKLQSLEMPHTVFNIESEPLKQANPSQYGNENIHFLIAANPGQPLGLLKKIASGGELSRISLSIQAISAQQTAIPTLILDEVDVGISGKTAAIVGNLIRALGANAQILCITHLPQVAAQGHHHFKVAKVQSVDQTTTNITPLNRTERIQELARLMGGTSITPEALAHAERLLEEEFA